MGPSKATTVSVSVQVAEIQTTSSDQEVDKSNISDIKLFVTIVKVKKESITKCIFMKGYQIVYICRFYFRETTRQRYEFG